MHYLMINTELKLCFTLFCRWGWVGTRCLSCCLLCRRVHRGWWNSDRVHFSWWCRGVLSPQVNISNLLITRWWRQCVGYTAVFWSVASHSTQRCTAGKRLSWERQWYHFPSRSWQLDQRGCNHWFDHGAISTIGFVNLLLLPRNARCRDFRGFPLFWLSSSSLCFLPLRLVAPFLLLDDLLGSAVKGSISWAAWDSLCSIAIPGFLSLACRRDGSEKKSQIGSRGASCPSSSDSRDTELLRALFLTFSFPLQDYGACCGMADGSSSMVETSNPSRQRN